MSDARERGTGLIEAAPSVMAILRKQRGITQIQLAQMIGKHQSFVSNMENGMRVRFAVLQKVADILGWAGDPRDLQRPYGTVPLKLKEDSTDEVQEA